MALEKADPLPVGRYWIDLFGPPVGKVALDGRAFFETWREKFSDRVRVRVSESFDSDPPRDFRIFEVIDPAPWGDIMASKLGFPTVAPPDIQTSDDTVQKPDVRDLPDTPLETVGKLLMLGGALVLGTIALVSIASLFNSARAIKEA